MLPNVIFNTGMRVVSSDVTLVSIRSKDKMSNYFIMQKSFRHNLCL